MEYTIYVITNEVNGKEYVGVTSQGVERRWREHKRAARKDENGHLYNAIRKYGADKFSVQPVEHFEARKQAFDVEKQWIADLDTYHGEGYNMSEGGELPPRLTGEDHPMYGRTGEDAPMYGRTGEDNPNSKLTSDEAGIIKWCALNSTFSQKEIGQMFGVSDGSVSKIKRGLRYPDIDPKPPAQNGQLRLPLGAT